MSERFWRTDPENFAELIELSRQKRKEPTEAEKALWNFLRDRGVANLKFRRQHTIGRYIVDFYCSEAKLVVEIDGSSNDDMEVQEWDQLRQKYLEEIHKLRVVRFRNEQIFNDIHKVIEIIKSSSIK